MLTRGLDADPSVEVRNENDRAVFHRFRLRPDPVLTAAIRRSRHRFVLVKPLCDTHRVDELLGLAGVAPGRALWAYRDVDDRARSEVAKFGDANLRALRAIADGTIGDRWQGQRLDPSVRELIAGFDHDRMTPTPPPPCSGTSATRCTSPWAWPTARTPCSARTTRWSPTRPGTPGGCARSSTCRTTRCCTRTSARAPRRDPGWRSTPGYGRCAPR